VPELGLKQPVEPQKAVDRRVPSLGLMIVLVKKHVEVGQPNSVLKEQDQRQGQVKDW